MKRRCLLLVSIFVILVCASCLVSGPVMLDIKGNKTSISAKQLKESLPDSPLNKVTSMNKNNAIDLYYLGKTLTVFPEDTDTWYSLHLSLVMENGCSLYVLCMLDESKINGKKNDLRAWDQEYDKVIRMGENDISYKCIRLNAERAMNDNIITPERTREVAMWRDHGRIYYVTVTYPEVMPSVETSYSGGTMEEILKLF